MAVRSAHCAWEQRHRWERAAGPARELCHWGGEVTCPAGLGWLWNLHSFSRAVGLHHGTLWPPSARLVQGVAPGSCLSSAVQLRVREVRRASTRCLGNERCWVCTERALPIKQPQSLLPSSHPFLALWGAGQHSWVQGTSYTLCAGAGKRLWQLGEQASSTPCAPLQSHREHPLTDNGESWEKQQGSRWWSRHFHRVLCALWCG